MIIWRGRYLENDHPDGPASGGEGLLQMIIQRDRPFANDHPEGLASSKLSSGGAGLLHMNIGRDWPLANDHLSPCHPSHLCQDTGSISRTFLEQCVLVSFQLKTDI